jgi:hypothetical protein
MIILEMREDKLSGVSNLLDKGVVDDCWLDGFLIFLCLAFDLESLGDLLIHLKFKSRSYKIYNHKFFILNRPTCYNLINL